MPRGRKGGELVSIASVVAVVVAEVVAVVRALTLILVLTFINPTLAPL